MMSMQSSDVMECETSASEASGNVSSADMSTWSTYLLGRIARFPTMRVNFSGEEKRCDDSGGGVGGKELRAREEEHRAATSEQERARSSESNAPAGRPRALPAHKTHVDTRIFEVDEEGTTPREDGRRGNSLIYLLIYPSTSCDYSDSASAIVLLLQHNELLVRAAATSDIANRTFESEEDAMGNPDKERLSGFKHATHVCMILRSQAKNRVCEDLYVRIGTPGADRDALQTRCQAICRNEIRRARGTLYTLRLTTSSRIIILGRYSTTTMKYETWVAEIFQEVLLSIKQQGSSSQALHPRDAPFSKGPPYPYPLSLRSAILSPTCVPDDREHRDAAQYALLNGNAFSCTTDAIGFSRLSAVSTTSLMQPVLRRHWRAATVSPPIYEANTPGRLY
ncbi:hypothetical protein ALC53_13405 [Atta colombica]|uniref:Uncharacterized protein n=1 Tax=Atta colombica TaxID=520822 RepID=A0A195AVV9_9HYME|nr:hypothetical protein ALC53_13405 [Atta colombica]